MSEFAQHVLGFVVAFGLAWYLVVRFFNRLRQRNLKLIALQEELRRKRLKLDRENRK